MRLQSRVGLLMRSHQAKDFFHNLAWIFSDVWLGLRSDADKAPTVGNPRIKAAYFECGELLVTQFFKSDLAAGGTCGTCRLITSQASRRKCRMSTSFDW